MPPILVFDIETVPDVAGLRRARNLPSVLSDGDVLDWATQQRRVRTGGDFFPVQFQRVVAISCALRDAATFRVWSLGDPQDGEAELIRRFYDGIDRYVPQLVSWNGGGFDLPVLHHRAMVHGVLAARYWDWGDEDREFRFNNYLNRYHTRHLDLMEVLGCFQSRTVAKLDEMARLCGFPGKLGMDGSKVNAAFLDGRIEEIRNYCETDVMNTYLLYLRFQQIRGTMSAGEYAAEVSIAREKIATSGAAHWREFIAAWDANTVAG